MATYVTSDAHGHLRALDRTLELAAPGSADTVYILGDMVDRGPEPVGVLRLARSLPSARVLMGNHERMMLDALMSDDVLVAGDWQINGGWITSEQLDALPREELVDLVGWVESLPLFDVVEVEDAFSRGRARGGEGATRAYLLCHAGIDALSARGYLATAGVPVDEPGALARLSAEQLRQMMRAQDADDLLWIRGNFWDGPTGLVDGEGRGAVVVSGHTPSIYLARYARMMGGPVLDSGGHARIVEVGACRDTGGMADRIDIDASAAAGYPNGQVAVMRLEDHRVWYAPVVEGE